MVKLTGTIQSGAGKGAYFTSLGWVISQLRKEMGFAPFPGTLNVRVADDDLPKMKAFFSEKDFELVPDDPQFCSAKVKKVKVNGITGVAVFPSEDVRIHGNEIVEIISSCHIKDALRLSDGDEVTITEFKEPLSGPV